LTAGARARYDANDSQMKKRAVSRRPELVLGEAVVRLGYRLTGPRRVVADVLAAAREPLTVAQIHRAAGPDPPNLASVYRAIHLLARIGLARMTDAGRSRPTARYELTEPFAPHHHHLICQACDRIKDLDGCPVPPDALRRLSRRLGRAAGFQVTAHELRLFGRCRECRA
jgi:Fur family transcriptional regulator, ferric uptake regulator